METKLTLELGTLITLATILFSAGGFYMLTSSMQKRTERVLQSLSENVQNLNISFAQINQRLAHVEKFIDKYSFIKV